MDTSSLMNSHDDFEIIGDHIVCESFFDDLELTSSDNIRYSIKASKIKSISEVKRLIDNSYPGAIVKALCEEMFVTFSDGSEVIFMQGKNQLVII